MIDKGRNKSRRIIEKKRTARREKMYQAVEKIINLLVSIATVLSVLLTYFTLSEMKEERESAYRPDIQFNSVEYVVKLQQIWNYSQKLIIVQYTHLINTEMRIFILN